ncbi:MAG TPA: DMT family transporter [Ideonella sp.]|nr:DMT family transporter [Ideonella sp.]
MADSAGRPVAALVVNAFVWGVSWWPLRQLEARGLHPLWTTVIVYALSAALLVVARPRAPARLARTPALWVLVLASGTTNAAFNWAVVAGDVVRVVLLFYLMPLWAVLLAWLLLGERPTRRAAARIALALGGAALVLGPGAAGGSGAVRLADMLGLVGGFAFALNNVMLRRLAAHDGADRALAMFAGGVLVAGMLAAALGARGTLPWPPPVAPGWTLGAALLGLLFLASNLALQYGAARLPAHVTAVVMLSEVVFASVSALALGAGVLTAPLAAGAALIVGAALLATLDPGR